MEVQNSIPKKVWTLLACVWLTQAVSQAIAMGYGMFMPSIMQDVGVSYATMGNVAGTSSILQVLLTIPICVFAVKLNPKYVIPGVSILISAGFFVYSRATSVPMLYIGRILSGSLVQVLGTMLTVIKVRGVPNEKIVTINGIENFVGPLGQTIGTLAMAQIMALLGGWQNVYSTVAAIILVCTIVYFVVYGDGKMFHYGLPAAPGADVPKRSVLADIREAWKNKVVWAVAIAWPGTTIIWMGMFYYFPSYATTELGFSLAQAGLLVALIPIFSAIGSITAPLLSKKLGKDKPIIVTASILAAFSYFMAMRVTSFGALCFFIALAGYCAYVFVPLAFSILYKMGLSTGATTIAYGTVMTFLSLGSAISGSVIGVVVANIGLKGGLTAFTLTPLWFSVIAILFFPELGPKKMADTKT